MPVLVEDFIQLYVLPSGRAIYALRKVVEAAVALEEPVLAAVAGEALAQAEDVRRLELTSREVQQLPLYGPAARELDGLVDGTLKGIEGLLKVHSQLDPTSPEGQSATRLLGALFGRGLQAITSLTYLEEAESVRLMLERLTGDLAEDAGRVGLLPFITRLKTQNDAFMAEITRAPKAEGPTWDEIRAARAGLAQSLAKLVVRCLARFVEEDAASVAARTALLDPIAEQQRALAALYKTRRGGKDVDPETGETPSPATP